MEDDNLDSNPNVDGEDNIVLLVLVISVVIMVLWFKTGI